jgi:hypothetical protein
VLASLKDDAEAVRALATGAPGTGSVALAGTLASTEFSAMLRQFGRRQPNVKRMASPRPRRPCGRR